MEELPGERAGTRRFYYAGYLYHLDARNEVFETYRCATRGRIRCRGAVRVEGGRLELISPHDTHEPNLYSMLEALMKAELLELCRDTFLSPLQIYREVSEGYG